MHNPAMNDLIRRLTLLLNDRALSAEQRRTLSRILASAHEARITYEEAIEEAKAIGIRNPGFDGDEVGWPDDDFV